MRLDYVSLNKTLFSRLMALETALRGSDLDSSLVNLLKVRASQINGCLFCTDMHLKEAVLSGEEKLKLFHLNHWHESKLFSDREKTALYWLEALTEAGKSGANDEAFDNLKQYFDDEKIVDMTYVISMINFWNRLGLAFKPDPGSLDEMYGLNKVAL